MKDTRLIMGMPVTIEIIDPKEASTLLEKAFSYFSWVDATFSTFKPDSEISRINAGLLSFQQACPEVQAVLRLCEYWKERTNGFFDIYQSGKMDPSGLVKGWAIAKVADLITADNFFVDAGGDVQTQGLNSQGKLWRVGIRNPFNIKEIVKVVSDKDIAVATSGTYERGKHIYNPQTHKPVTEIISLTVVGADIYTADCLATAAFAMGKIGLEYIESQPNVEGYMIDKEGNAYKTSQFERYEVD